MAAISSALYHTPAITKVSSGTRAVWHHSADDFGEIELKHSSSEDMRTPGCSLYESVFVVGLGRATGLSLVCFASWRGLIYARLVMHCFMWLSSQVEAANHCAKIM